MCKLNMILTMSALVGLMGQAYAMDTERDFPRQTHAVKLKEASLEDENIAFQLYLRALSILETEERVTSENGIKKIAELEKKRNLTYIREKRKSNMTLLYGGRHLMEGNVNYRWL